MYVCIRPCSISLALSVRSGKLFCTVICFPWWSLQKLNIGQRKQPWPHPIFDLFEIPTCSLAVAPGDAIFDQTAYNHELNNWQGKKHCAVYLWKDTQTLNAGEVRPAAAVVLLCGQIIFLWYSGNFSSTHSQVDFKSMQNSYEHECYERAIVWFKVHPYFNLMSGYNVLQYFQKFLLSYSSLV